MSPSKLIPITLEECKRAPIRSVLETTRWKVSGKNRAAPILDLVPTTLEAKIKNPGSSRNG